MGRLQAEYGHGGWRKYKGEAMVQTSDGKMQKAEVHWYQAHGVGRQEVKIKRYLDICVNNFGYPASLQVGKSYEVLPDDSAGPDEIRVVDESGEDYLYPAEYFSSEDQTPIPDPALYEDIIREIRGFIEENEGLLDEASFLVLGRVYTQGVRIFTTINDEVVDATNRAAAAKRALAEAVRDSTVSPHKLQQLEAEEAHASQVHLARMVASTELDNFLKRVHAPLSKRGTDGPEQK